MLVLGIDPGTAITGFGFVRELSDGKLDVIDYGVIETASKLSPGERLLELYRALNKRISLHKPECGAVEKLFFQKNVTTALSVGQARGVAILALAEVGIPIFEYTPMEVKLAVSGYGSAQKEQVQTMVKALLSLEEIPEPDDAADALAIAICHIHNQKFKHILSQNK
jgi:crossover junction endodeoxyribonuclease RuvC